MTSTPITLRAEQPPVRCTSWCADGTGHRGQRHRADQYCYSFMLEMSSTLHRPGEGVMVIVYVRKDPDGSEPYVVVNTPGDDDLFLTVDEARGLIERLAHMVWVADQDGRERNAFVLGRDSVRTGDQVQP